ncbi:MAG: LicD family protein [Bacilli bacterium]
MNQEKIYYLKKDIDGNKNPFTKLHEILLEGVIEIDRICRKNNIPYALAFGSCLGICNYQGFIPWDDDVDIVINYEDKDRFIAVMNEELSDKYHLDCYENDKRYNVLVPSMKLRIHNTLLVDSSFMLPNRINKIDNIFIDICYFMGVPSKIKEHKKALYFTKRKVVPYVISDYFFHHQPYKLKEKIKKFEEEFYIKYKNSDFISQTPILPFQNFKKKDNQISFPKEVIYPFKEYEFCHHKFYSFNDVHRFCEIFYGKDCFVKEINNEMVDPFPLKKRKSNHIRKYCLTREK